MRENGSQFRGAPSQHKVPASTEGHARLSRTSDDSGPWHPSCFFDMRPFTRFLPLLVLGVGCSGEIGGPTGSAPADPSYPQGLPGSPGTDASGNPLPAGQVPGPGGMPTTAGTVPGLPVVPPGADPVLDAPPLPLQLDGEPDYARAVRLTHDQWENSVRYVLGVDDSGQRGNLAEDLTGFHTFSNHEELLFLNANLYRDYQMAAEELTAAIGLDPEAIGRIYAGEDAQGFIETVGRRAFRRPLEADEVQALQTLYDEGAALTENGSTPHARGASLVLQALLQSPYFLYRLETGEPGARLSSLELAAKLSLLLLRSTPDDALLDRAERGEFDSDGAVESLASDMLENPAAASTMRDFHGELFKFARYLQISKEVQVVPEYRPELNEELQEAAYLFFDRIYQEDLGLTDILTSTVGFVGPNMAPLYDMEAQGPGFQEVDLGPDRPGFFTHLPFLVLNAVNLVPDSIHRGVALNLEVLCGEIPPPPDDMVALNPVGEGQTNRERVTATSGVGTCGQPCHAPYINPLGFAFENYDGMGRLRTTDNGNPIDTKSAYPFVEGVREFDGAPQLMQIMAEGEQAHACYAKHLSEFALQRDLTEEERDEIDALSTASRGGASIKELLTSIVTNPTFTTRQSGGTP